MTTMINAMPAYVRAQFAEAPAVFNERPLPRISPEAAPYLGDGLLQRAADLCEQLDANAKVGVFRAPHANTLRAAVLRDYLQAHGLDVERMLPSSGARLLWRVIHIGDAGAAAVYREAKDAAAAGIDLFADGGLTAAEARRAFKAAQDAANRERCRAMGTMGRGRF